MEEEEDEEDQEKEGEEEDAERRNKGKMRVGLLQSYNNEDTMVLVEEQTRRSLEYNQEPRNRHTNIIEFHKGSKTVQWRIENDFSQW